MELRPFYFCLGVAMFEDRKPKKKKARTPKESWYAEKFTPGQDEIIKARYPFLDSEELANELGVSVRLLRNRAYALGVRKFKRIGKWTEAMDRELIRRYPTEHSEDIGKDLGVSRLAVQQRAFHLKIRKDPEFSKQINKENKTRSRKQGAENDRIVA